MKKSEKIKQLESDNKKMRDWLIEKDEYIKRIEDKEEAKTAGEELVEWASSLFDKINGSKKVIGYKIKPIFTEHPTTLIQKTTCGVEADELFHSIFEPVYDSGVCPKCNGSRWIPVRLPSGELKFEPCQHCRTI